MRNLTIVGTVFLVCYLIVGQAAPLRVDEAGNQYSQPETTVKRYLSWYKQNRERVQKIRVLTGTPGDSTKAYAVDFNGVESYLSEIKKSGLVSDSYIRDFSEYFKRGDDYLKKNPQFDGFAVGFGIDLVFKAHDYFEILDSLQKLKILSKSINGNKAKIEVQVASVKMVFSLTRSGDTWLIDSLGY